MSTINYKKYGMSRNRYQELSAFARQYSELKQKRTDLLSDLKNVEENAIKAAEIKTKIELIEECVNDSCSDIPIVAKYLLKNVTEGTAYERMNVPLYKAGFLLRRKLFFIELNKRKK